MPPVVRAIKVLRYIAAGKSVANQAQAARALGINRTTLLRLLHTLEVEGLIEAVPGGTDYVLGGGIVELARGKLGSLDVAQVAAPVLAELAARLGLSCHLGVLDGREVVYVARHAPNVPLVSNVQVGTRLPAHASTIGRAILAHMPWADVEARFRGRPLHAVTAKTATTLAALERQLAAGPRRGLRRQPLELRGRHRFRGSADLRSCRHCRRRDQRVGAGTGIPVDQEPAARDRGSPRRRRRRDQSQDGIRPVRAR